MNFMLDEYPSDYKGYLIRTDYRIGVQLTLCAEDCDLTEYEKAVISMSLLYGAGMPDIQTALEGLQWFMSAGKEQAGEHSNEPKVMSLDIDSGLIVSGFRRAYGIDLNREKMHWFEFIQLLGDLGECALSGVVDIRTADTKNLKGASKAKMEKLKRKYALPVTFSREEQDAINKFFNSSTPDKTPE